MVEADNKLNPSTGISDFAKSEETPRELVARQRKEQERFEFQKSLAKLEAQSQVQQAQPKQVIIKQITKPKKSVLSRLGFLRRAKPIQDRLKVMRLSNLLEKKRLINQIQKMKLQRQVENLKRKGKLTQVMTMPVIKSGLTYPAYATPEMMGDIDSMYADIGHADGDLFGGEQYFDENFYGEDFWSHEFDGDVFEHLQIKPRQGVHPLLW